MIFLITPIESFKYFGSNYFIKREDLFGGLFNGIKQRKIQSILAFLKKTRPKQVALKGSVYSNFLVAIASELRKDKIPFAIYTNRYHKEVKPKGNFFFLSLFLSPSMIHPIETLKEDDKDLLIIEEGGDILPGYLGLLSLGEEILTQNHALNLQLKNIWIDAGTGASAACLYYTLLQAKSPICLHIVSMKENLEAFHQKVDEIFFHLNAHFMTSIKNEKSYCFYRPKTGKAFGSTNRYIFEEIKELAQHTGILFDPIYSIKMISTMKEHLSLEPTLLIHSGGTLSLSGFQDNLN